MKRVIQSRPVRFVLDMLDLYFNKHVSRAAAELAYFLILSFFPVLICVNAIIGTLDLDVAALLENAAIIIPEAALTVLTEYVGYISTNQSGALLVGGVIMMLFSASAAMRSLMNVMDEIYDRKSYTGLWQIVASVVFSVLFLLTIYLSVVVVLTGNWFFHSLGQLLKLDDLVERFGTWQWVKYLLLLGMVFLFILLLYRFAAPLDRPRPPVVPGAMAAAVALAIASMIFSALMSGSTQYSLIYGSLASVVIMLVWLYLCGNILILGNVVNYVIYKHRKEARR